MILIILSVFMVVPSQWCQFELGNKQYMLAQSGPVLYWLVFNFRESILISDVLVNAF